MNKAGTNFRDMKSGSGIDLKMFNVSKPSEHMTNWHRIGSNSNEHIGGFHHPKHGQLLFQKVFDNNSGKPMGYAMHHRKIDGTEHPVGFFNTGTEVINGAKNYALKNKLI